MQSLPVNRWLRIAGMILPAILSVRSEYDAEKKEKKKLDAAPDDDAVSRCINCIFLYSYGGYYYSLSKIQSWFWTFWGKPMGWPG